MITLTLCLLCRGRSEPSRSPLIPTAMEAIPIFQKLIAPSDPKDDIYPRMYRWQCNQKPKDFYKVDEKLKSSQQLSKMRKVNDGVITVHQLRWVMRKHRRDMLELKGSIQSLKDAIQTLEDRIIGQILDGGPSSHHDGSQHDYANDRQDDELGVDDQEIDHDMVGIEGDNVTHTDEGLDENVEGDGNL
ncbi:Uncharacterized protein TCM_035676 [Theobroma cacao]|uniref:Uncharacterized protein n=1 Tax=Theobroma cacao TaxID=3641 RepID=A0A061FHI9_THECC|nr:Uncharacterized protein TCM_035676 [Theobroma cacao]